MPRRFILRRSWNGRMRLWIGRLGSWLWIWVWKAEMMDYGERDMEGEGRKVGPREEEYGCRVG
jgi:hypothetical protein